jgi:acetylornithine deacetylase/succinyl-diaminopimelate desuccinylase-like protein
VSTAATVAENARQGIPAAIHRLGEYLAIPAISCDPAHHADVRTLAHRIAEDLRAFGMTEVEVLELEGALPSVAATLATAGPDKPTVLIYGHLDLQPVKGEPWETPPHQPTRKGDRLYARGAADDMGGWVSHMAAMKAWKDHTGALPCNIKLFIEGEEEIGSPNLERFMDAFPARFEADVMVLTDCENPSVDVPGLTVSLRGLCEMELVVEALGADIHSGLWGNMVPDVSIGLVRLLDRLCDEDGRLRIGRVDVPEDWRQSVADLPPGPEAIAEGAHLLPGVPPLPLRGKPAAEWLWRQPALTIVSTTLPTIDRKKNALRTAASAILSIRVAPGQTPDALLAAISAELLRDPPFGLRVRVNALRGNGESWLYEPRGPAFEAADRAYTAAWGRPLVRVGIGGSIPFVALFGRRFSRLPLILNGVMDPATTAHGPNESLHLGVFEKAVVANVFLYDELGALSPAALQT